MTAYQQLETVFIRWNTLQGASSILHWDNATMMPAMSGDIRAEQLSILAQIGHEIITDPKLQDIFAEAEAKGELLNDWQQANLREMKRLWQHSIAVPAGLVSALTKAGIESEQFWRKARKENNFKDFIPYQQNVLKLVRESAQAKSEALKLSPYDALLDQYDPGTRSNFLDIIFNDLAEFLPIFIQKAIERQSSQKPPVAINESIPALKQKELGVQFMKKLGFDFNRGRLDESAHPFCGGVAGDVRLTTRYNEQDFLSGFYGVMHETGHALYEMGLPVMWRNQPVGQARGMALHESQSLLSEMQLCISRDFLEYAVPVFHKIFSVSSDAWSVDNIYALMTHVSPSLIRVEADEVTYPAHIILRYKLERQMIDGQLEIKDLPEAWSSQMKLLLGIVPDQDSNGCMQDIHWTDGAFGYFPTYTLGAMMAAQLFQALSRSIPDINKEIRKGNFAIVFDWLRAHIHSLGSKYTSSELMKMATGEPLNIAYYKKHLETRYLE